MTHISLLMTTLIGLALCLSAEKILDSHINFHERLSTSFEKLAFLSHCGPLKQATMNLTQACRYLVRRHPGVRVEIETATRNLSESLDLRWQAHNCSSGLRWKLKPQVSRSPVSGLRDPDWPGYSFYYYDPL